MLRAVHAYQLLCTCAHASLTCALLAAYINPPSFVQPQPQEFYEDVFEEAAVYGEIEGLNVCDNLADHMVGLVFGPLALQFDLSVSISIVTVGNG